MTVHVWGQAACMPGLPDVAAVLAAGGVSEPEAALPELEGYPSRLMRGTSTLTRMCAAVARQSLRHAEVAPESIAAVFGSAAGEITIAVDQLTMMVTGDGQISPARFKNSVHNTSAGVFSVAHANRTSSTSVAAGPLTVGYALLEAQLLLDAGARHVLVVVGDEALPEPLDARGRWPSFAAGWVLGREAPQHAGLSLEMSPVVATEQALTTVPSVLAQHPCAGAYALLKAVAQAQVGTLVLGREDQTGLAVTLTPHESPK